MQKLDETSAFHFYTSPQGKCNPFTRYKPERASEFQLNAIPRGSKNLMVIQPSNEPGKKNAKLAKYNTNLVQLQHDISSKHL